MSPLRLRRRPWLRRAFLAGAGFCTAGLTLRQRLSPGPGWKGEVSDHFDGKRFFNPGHPDLHDFRHILKWKIERKAAEWPERAEEPNATPDLTAPPAGKIAVTAVGHATFLLRTRDLAILTDPVWSERCSPVGWAGPRRVRPPGVPFDDLPKIDVVLLSHNHYDHLDLATLERLRERDDPLILTGLGNRAFLEGHGFARVRERDWWEPFPDLPPGLEVTFVPARHWSNRGSGGRNTTLWGGFVARLERQSVYFCGDSGYFDGFKEIGKRLGPPDLALLPVGAYEPRWFMSPMHMNPDDAVRAHLDLRAKRSLGCHFGVWQLTDEAIDAPLHALAAARRARGVAEEDFRAPAFGETVVV